MDDTDEGTGTLLERVKTATSATSGRNKRTVDGLSGRWLLALNASSNVVPELVTDDDWLHATLGVEASVIAGDVDSLRAKRGLTEVAGKMVEGVRVFRASAEEGLGGKGFVWLAFNNHPSQPVVQQLETAAVQAKAIGQPRTRQRTEAVVAELRERSAASSFVSPMKGT
tara:strand:+ start:102 stop:608 length:507 start_codon:yes stop_codon:yes gene_type:complete